MELVEVVDRFYTPLLCLFGGIGNGLSVYVFCMTAGHRNLSASYYLSALAISDIGFLINLFAVWLTGEGIEVITTRFSCPFVMYLGQVTCFLSVWFTVAFTWERFCAVCYPLTRPVFCTVARAKKVIGCITAVALVVFSYVWVIATIIPVSVPAPMDEASLSIGNGTLGNGTLNGTDSNLEDSSRTNYVTFFCSVPARYHGFSMMANHLDSFFTLILPFFVITFLNVRITLCVWKFKGERETIVAATNLKRTNSTASEGKCQILIRQSGTKDKETLLTKDMVSSGKGQSSSNCGPCYSGKAQKEKSKLFMSFGRKQCLNQCRTEGSKQELSKSSPVAGKKPVPHSSAAEVRVTKTLLLVSTVFLVLNLPAHAIRAYGFVQRDLLGRTLEDSSAVNSSQHWANILFNTNFSVNFLLYCVSGRNFRISLRNLCCSDRKGGHKNRRLVTKPFVKRPGSAGGGTQGPNPLKMRKIRNEMETGDELESSLQCCPDTVHETTPTSHHFLCPQHNSSRNDQEMSSYPTSRTEVEIETYYS